MLGIRKALTKDVTDELDRLERQLESNKRNDEAELKLLRQQMARIAQGVALDEAAIMDGQLYNDIATPELMAFIEAQSPIILDVRTDGEWGGGHIPGAKHVPIDQLSARLSELADYKDRAILAYCAAGARSAAACDLLSANGFMSLHNVSGGIGAYKGQLER